MNHFLFIENLFPYFKLEGCHGRYYRHNNPLTRKWGAASLLITGVEFLNTRQPLLIIHAWDTVAIPNLGVSMVPGSLSVCLCHHRALRPFNERVQGCFCLEDLSRPYYTLLLRAQDTVPGTQDTGWELLGCPTSSRTPLKPRSSPHWLTGTLVWSRGSIKYATTDLPEGCILLTQFSLCQEVGRI